MTDLTELSATWLTRVEAKLDRVLPPGDAAPARLHEAMRYSVLGGGKRVRPLLVYATGAALDIDPVGLDVPAAAIELMHAFSLVHDDLPAMDDDDLRRGRATTHKAFDEATAILAADAMQPLAFRILAMDPDLRCRPESRLRMIDALAAACGSLGMTGGQSIDLGSEGRRLDAAELENMYRLKTGCLLEASVLCAAYAGDAPNEQLQPLERFVSNLGLAFQIRDDVLDIEGDTQTIGKRQGADIARNKATWPALFGLDGAKQRTAELLDEALGEMENFGPRADPLRDIARYIVARQL